MTYSKAKLDLARARARVRVRVGVKLRFRAGARAPETSIILASISRLYLAYISPISRAPETSIILASSFISVTQPLKRTCTLAMGTRLASHHISATSPLHLA